MKLHLLEGVLPDVYKEDLSNSFEKLFNCSAKKLDYFGNSWRLFIKSPVIPFTFHSGLNFQSQKFYSTKYSIKRTTCMALLVFCIFSVLKEILCRKWVDEHYFNVSMVGGTVLMVRWTAARNSYIVNHNDELRLDHEYC